MIKAAKMPLRWPTASEFGTIILFTRSRQNGIKFLGTLSPHKSKNLGPWQHPIVSKPKRMLE